MVLPYLQSINITLPSSGYLVNLVIHRAEVLLRGVLGIDFHKCTAAVTLIQPAPRPAAVLD